MKNNNKYKNLIDYVPNSLDYDLQMLLNEADSLIGEKLSSEEQIIDRLLLIDTYCSNMLATNIINIKKEIEINNEYLFLSNNQYDDPFLTLHSDDDEY